MNRPTGHSRLAAWALAAELAIVGLLVCYGPFSAYRLILLVLIASQSLWHRGLTWSDVGLRRPTSPERALLQAIAATVVVLLAVRAVIVPTAVWLAGVPLDLSSLSERGDTLALWIWLGQAWTLAAFGEEMVFRGYLITRLGDVAGDTTFGRLVAIVISSALFGIGHGYQGWAGVMATGAIGVILSLLYVGTRNLWVVIVCHALVDTVILSVIYFGRPSWLFPLP